MFLLLCKVLKTSPRDLLLDGDADSNVDPLAVRIAALNHPERLKLWHDLADNRRGDRRTHMRERMRRLADEVEELLAQLEFVRVEMESFHVRMRKR